MIKALTIIGARPQFIKAAALSRAIKSKFSDAIEEIVVHTGQHYDDNMSKVFFDEMGMPKEKYNLQVGSGSHTSQTATMLLGIEKILTNEKPNCVVLYGDTNSTLAGAMAAIKRDIPVVHIEAGLRSFNKTMPEEINRIVCDHSSTLLFSPTETGYQNLLNEGFKKSTSKQKSTLDHPGIYHCGDVMYDNALYFSKLAGEKSDILQKHSLSPDGYVLSTIHRDNNTDNPERLTAIFSALNKISLSNNLKIVLPLHPRTAKLLDRNVRKNVLEAVKANSNFLIIAPASFFEMIVLESNCHLVCTDSGGVQKEAYFYEKPCIIMRPETEWVELTQSGAAILADADESKILQAFSNLKNTRALSFPKIFGDGQASEFICQEIINTFS